MIAVLAGAAAFAGFSASSASAAACDNEAIRESQTSAALPAGTTYLPDCMGLEMISAPRKFNQAAVAPNFSRDGERVRFRSAAAIAETPGLQSLLDKYIATRGAGGWALSPTSPPASARITAGARERGGPFGFNSAFDGWLLLGATQEQVQAGIGRVYRDGLTGDFEPVSPFLIPINNSGAPRIVVDITESESTGSSADLSTTVFYPKLASTSYLPGDPTTLKEAEPGGDLQNYVAHIDAGGSPSVELLTRDGDGTVFGGRCGSHLGGGVGSIRGTGRLNQGAISPDGGRIFFTTRPNQPAETECAPSEALNPLRIFQRLRTSGGPEVSELISGGPAAGSDYFQGASVDGSLVYFTSARQLTASDKDSGTCDKALGGSGGCDLYLYDATLPPGERLIDVSAGGTGDPSPGEGADVLNSITALAADGSRAYFVAQGVLTTDPNPEGAVASAGAPNLYVYDRDGADGGLSFIGTLVSSDLEAVWGVEQSFVGNAYAVPLLGSTPGEGGDGHVLVFATGAALTADDSDTVRDVFRYDAAADELIRVSKAAPGGSETPASDASVNPNETAPNASAPEEGRWVSEDGSTIAFSTAEPLVVGDEDEVANPYFWRDGELFRLPGDEEDPTLSASGTQVGFASREQLLPEDGDSASDVYIVRAGGGYPPAPIVPICISEACQGPPQPAPGLLPPGSSGFVGEGNPKPRPKCKKGFVRKKGKCVRKHKKKNNKKTKSRSRALRGGK